VFTLTVTDANGCTSTATRTLNDPPALQITAGIIDQPGQGQSDGSIDVNVAGGTGTYSFIWYRNNNLFGSGSEDLTNAPAGDYRLEVTDANGCTAVFNYILTETVGSYDPQSAFYAAVFPNPARDRATLSVAFPQPQTLRLSLSDAAGRTLHAWTVDNAAEQHIPLDLQGLPGGVYLLRIVAGDAVVERKVVVGR
jgi:hypothetical protein